MKMVKSLLLGSAAALVAVTAGQAADLPVKARPVEYVKVCSLYGAGFYYMPGTDMCLKIGGWVREEVTYGNDNGSLTWGPFDGQQNIRGTSNLATRARGYITADAREQTAYGTARAYIDVGINDNDTTQPSAAFNSNRAFLQWAGITAGITQSFYDFYSAAAVAYRAAFMPIEDTGDGGQMLFAYTAQLGNGLSATISAENRRDTTIVGALGGAVSAGTVAVTTAAEASAGYGGNQAPDIVANLRLDQTWGSAQVMGALHELNALYYDNAVASGDGLGHPSDDWGFVVGAGLRLNFPMIAQGDYFQGEVNYTQGAMRYLNQPTMGTYGDLNNNNTGAYGEMTDCVYGASGLVAGAIVGGTSCNKTSAWSLNASYEHYWTPSVHESFVGAVEGVSYNTQGNAILCTLQAEGTVTAATGYVPAAGCNNNWSTWGVSSRLQWDVTKSFYLGVEVMYDHLNSATSSTGLVPGALALNGVPGPATATVGGAAENAWSATFRMHKDFLP
ncbi:MAG: porin [Xanthobacteraceae bacterium]